MGASLVVIFLVIRAVQGVSDDSSSEHRLVWIGARRPNILVSLVGFEAHGSQQLSGLLLREAQKLAELTPTPFVARHHEIQAMV
jgi:hypothetical protein